MRLALVHASTALPSRAARQPGRRRGRGSAARGFTVGLFAADGRPAGRAPVSGANCGPCRDQTGRLPARRHPGLRPGRRPRAQPVPELRAPVGRRRCGSGGDHRAQLPLRLRGRGTSCATVAPAPIAQTGGHGRACATVATADPCWPRSPSCSRCDRGPRPTRCCARPIAVLCLSPRQQQVARGRRDRRGACLVDRANFLPAHLDPAPTGQVRPASERAGCVVVGRLSAEKGVVDLVDRWTGDMTLRVIGDGPDRAAVERAARGRPVEVVGRLDRRAAIDEIARARAVVLPGRTPEVAPLTYLEGLAAGTAVVVAETSDLASGIADRVGAAVRATWPTYLQSWSASPATRISPRRCLLPVREAAHRRRMDRPHAPAVPQPRRRCRPHVADTAAGRGPRTHREAFAPLSVDATVSHDV